MNRILILAGRESYVTSLSPPRCSCSHPSAPFSRRGVVGGSTVEGESRLCFPARKNGRRTKVASCTTVLCFGIMHGTFNRA
jgi:hypothetical protein